MYEDAIKLLPPGAPERVDFHNNKAACYIGQKRWVESSCGNRCAWASWHRETIPQTHLWAEACTMRPSARAPSDGPRRTMWLNSPRLSAHADPRVAADPCSGAVLACHPICMRARDQ